MGNTHHNMTPPLNHLEIARILPHGFPFLLVDRVLEIESGKRIVGVKLVSRNDRYLSRELVLAPTILTEAIAQIGAILILSNPEHRGRLPLFTGIRRLRVTGWVHLGDEVVIEAVMVRMRGRMGVLNGSARVDDKIVLRGTMTFAFGSKRN